MIIYSFRADLAQAQRLGAPLPLHGTLLGVIARGPGDEGALMRSPVGVYVQVNRGVLRTLDPGQVIGAVLRARMQRDGLNIPHAARVIGVGENTLKGWITYGKQPGAPAQELLRIRLPGIEL